MELVVGLQLFLIGLSFGFSGQCIFSCTPFLVAYLAGNNLGRKHSIFPTVLFFSGRLIAYLGLGLLAGLSAGLLRQFNASILTLYLKPIGGILIILSGLFILVRNEPLSGICKYFSKFSFTSLFIVGFIVGIFPCAPLIALLFEITLISKSPLQGLIYALFFGLGTFISGFITVYILAGILSSNFLQRLIKSRIANFIFRLVCALLIISFGVGFILKKL